MELLGGFHGVKTRRGASTKDCLSQHGTGDDNYPSRHDGCQGFFSSFLSHTHTADITTDILTDISSDFWCSLRVCVCDGCSMCVIFHLFRHWDRATMLSEPQRHIKASPPCAFTCAIVSLLTAIKCSIVLLTSDCLSFGSCLQTSCQNKACRHNEIKPTC